MTWKDFPQLPVVLEEEMQQRLATWYFDLQQALQTHYQELEAKVTALEEDAEVARTQKTLAQSSPVANTLTNLYVCLPRKRIENGTVIVTNRSNQATIYRISIAIASAQDDVKQYIQYDVVLAAQETRSVSDGIALEARDAVRVRSGNGLVSFTLKGEEVDV